MESICESMVYARELEAGHLLGFYQLVSWKSYSKDENTWEPTLALQHLRKLISTFHKNHPSKSKATSLPIDLASPIAKCIAMANVNGKRKHGQPVGNIQKKAKH